MIGQAMRAAVLVLAGTLGAQAAECDASHARIDWTKASGAPGSMTFVVEVADDSAERAQGLMGRESLPTRGGMLFVYDIPNSVAFWMKNTLIPLDMLFFDGAGQLVSLHENARPLDETPIPGGAGVQFVLEINGGLARDLGIGPDARLRHPAVGACD